MEQKIVKKIVIGSFALPLSILAFLWCCNIRRFGNFCLGDAVLKLMKLPCWSNGTHYTVFSA